MDIETPKSITNEMRNPQAWWDRYHGYGADCDVIDTAAMLKSYADRIDSSVDGLVKRAEDAIHVMAEVAGRLDASDCTTVGALVDLCQRCRGSLLDSAAEYWKFKIGKEKKAND